MAVDDVARAMREVDEAVGELRAVRDRLATVLYGLEIRQPEQPVRERVAYLLWQVNQGYLKAEDRAGGDNWFLTDPATLHEDDREERPHWLVLADEIIAAVGGDS